MSAEETAHSGPISAVADRRYNSAVTDRRYILAVTDRRYNRYNSTWRF